MSTDLVAWLLEQIDEDERRARAVYRSPLLNMIIAPRQGGKQSAADHVNNWMPPRVLTDCDARRRIVQLHAIRSGTGGGWDTDPPAVCNEDSDLHPCETLKLLALPYAPPYGARHGYREEWRP